MRSARQESRQAFCASPSASRIRTTSSRTSRRRCVKRERIERRGGEKAFTAEDTEAEERRIHRGGTQRTQKRTEKKPPQRTQRTQGRREGRWSLRFRPSPSPILCLRLCPRPRCSAPPPLSRSLSACAAALACPPP